jgi:uncharacterized protein (TIGR02611 family)
VVTYGAGVSGAVDAEQASTTSSTGSRLGRLRARVRAFPGGALAWRIGITFAGVAVIVVGIVLLPLPGPGWLIIFGGLGLLASEYAWAARLLTRARTLVNSWTRWALRQPLWVRILIGVGGVLLVLAVLAGSWFLYDVI